VTPTRYSFEQDPARFIVEQVQAFVVDNPGNRLKDLDGSPLFEEPLVAFAEGEDPLFQDYRRIIGEFHLTPREALERSGTAGKSPGSVSVISWVLPIAKPTKLANRKETTGPSVHWNQVRWLGQALNDSLGKHVVGLLQEKGYQAMVPDQAPYFEVRQLANGSASNWSQRHVAYAAGLGTFSLSDGLITTKGIALRLNSVVTDLKLPASPRKYSSHTANCPFLVNGSCGACIQRCPAGAITAQGHDKLKCRDWLQSLHKTLLGKPGYMGRYAACGLCQTKVPCESGIPKVKATG